MHTSTSSTMTAASVAPTRSRCPFSRLFGPRTVSLADTLRERTKEAHTRAEKHPSQARLVKGEATRQEYAAWLGQMLHVWRALDGGLVSLARSDARVARMLKPYHAHAARVESDLEFLGYTPEQHPALPATARCMAWLTELATNRDPALVGAWYVLEGSANGGRFIAKAVSRSLNIAGPRGLAALDPHGEQQRQYWQTWRTDLDAQTWTESEREAVVRAGSAMFDAVSAMLGDLHPQDSALG